MTFLAQVATPDEGLSNSLMLPLVLFLLVYVALTIAARVLGGRGEEERAEGLQDWAFAVLLLGAAYTAVLLVIAIASKFDLISDMVIIVLVLFAFFAVLIIGLLAIFDVAIGGVSRARKDRRSAGGAGSAPSDDAAS